MRVVLALGLVVLTALGGLGLHALRDRYQYVDETRLQAALLIFRPAERNGSATPVSAADLAPDRSTRTEPVRCRSLALLSTGAATGGGSWRGINGDPAQPVSTLTARFASAADARAELRAKRAALVGCRTVRLTFPPFDDPAEVFSVGGRLQPTLLAGDRLTYRLSSEKATYTFFVERFGNTLTWAYGSTESQPRTRREVVDDLARTLAELARQ